MSADLFFTSYAHADRTRALEKFVRELRAQVRNLAGLNLTEKQLDLVGFFDTTSIETGEDWAKAIGEGLRTCKVCVCLCSQTYFNRPFCGKEYHVFSARREGWLALPGNAGREARVIIPVLWRVTEESLPSLIRDIQLKDPAFPEAYIENGLEALANNRGQATSFRKATAHIASLVWKGVREVRLPALGALPPVDQIPSAFHRPTRYGVVLTCLHPKGLDWRPFTTRAGSVSLETEAVASQLRARLRTLSNDAKLAAGLVEAASFREAVLFIASPDVIRSPSAAATLQTAEATAQNFTVLVVWDSPSGRSQADVDAVTDALRAACPTALASGRIPDPSAIVAPEFLRGQLSETIEKLRRELATADPAVRAADADVEREAREAGIAWEQQPILSPNTGKVP